MNRVCSSCDFSRTVNGLGAPAADTVPATGFAEMPFFGAVTTSAGAGVASSLAAGWLARWIVEHATEQLQRVRVANGISAKEYAYNGKLHLVQVYFDS